MDQILKFLSGSTGDVIGNASELINLVNVSGSENDFLKKVNTWGSGNQLVDKIKNFLGPHFSLKNNWVSDIALEGYLVIKNPHQHQEFYLTMASQLVYTFLAFVGWILYWDISYSHHYIIRHQMILPVVGLMSYLGVSYSFPLGSMLGHSTYIKKLRPKKILLQCVYPIRAFVFLLWLQIMIVPYVVLHDAPLIIYPALLFMFYLITHQEWQLQMDLNTLANSDMWDSHHADYDFKLSFNTLTMIKERLQHFRYNVIVFHLTLIFTVLVIELDLMADISFGCWVVLVGIGFLSIDTGVFHDRITTFVANQLWIYVMYCGMIYAEYSVSYSLWVMSFCLFFSESLQTLDDFVHSQVKRIYSVSPFHRHKINRLFTNVDDSIKNKWMQKDMLQIQESRAEYLSSRLFITLDKKLLTLLLSLTMVIYLKLHFSYVILFQWLMMTYDVFSNIAEKVNQFL